MQEARLHDFSNAVRSGGRQSYSYSDIDAADRADPELEHALAPMPECEARVLRVLYDRGVDAVRVVTAFFDRTVRGKL